MSKNKKMYQISHDRSDIGIDLSDGKLIVNHFDASFKSNALRFDLYHVITNTRIEGKYGRGITLNIDQRLVKNEDDTYTLILADKSELIFKEKYYYKNEYNQRVYETTNGSKLKKSDIEIDLEGKLTYNGKEIFIDLKNDSGLVLSTDYDGFINSDKLDLRHEEIKTVENEIKQLEDAITELTFNLNEYGKYENADYLNMIDKQRQLENKSFDLEKTLKNQFDVLLGENNNYYASKETLYVRTKKSVRPVGGAVLNGNDFEFNDSKQRYTLTEGIYGYWIDHYESKFAINATDETDQRRLIYFREALNDYLEEINQQILGLGNHIEQSNWRNQKIVQTKKGELNTTQELYLRSKQAYEDDFLEKVKNYYSYLVRRINTKISDYESALELKQLEMEKLLKSISTNYIYSNDGIYYGFNTEGNLCMIFDNQNNAISIIYKNNGHVDYMIDGDKKTMNFNYDASGLLKSIEDQNGEIISFFYSDNFLIQAYCQNEDFLSFGYDMDRLSRITNHKSIEYVIGYLGSGSNIKPNVITKVSYGYNDGIYKEEDISEITYNVSETIVRDIKTDHEIHYLFDDDLSLTTEYGVLDGELTYTSSYDYKNEFYKFQMKKDKYSEEVFHVSDARTSSELRYDVDVSELRVCTTDYLLSAFCKAVAYKSPSYYLNGTNVKFEIRCNLHYGPEIVEFISHFNYKVDGKQFTAVPVTLYEDGYGNPVIPDRVEIIVDYSNNNGEMELFDLSLSTGDYNYVILNDSYNKTFECNNETIVSKIEDGIKTGYYVRKLYNYFSYDESDNMIRKYDDIIDEDYLADGTILSQTQKNLQIDYTYNKQNQLTKTIYHDGMVDENIYNDSGFLMKQKTYHKDNPGLAMVSENKIDEKGILTGSYDAYGNEIKYLYNEQKVLDKIEDTNGNVLTIENHDNDSKGISMEADGLQNRSIVKYNNNLITELNSNNTSYKYEYGDFKELKKILINDSEYVSYEQDDNIYTTTYNNDCGYIKQSDQYGKTLNIRYKDGDNVTPYITYEYDNSDNLVKMIDYVTEEIINYEYFDNKDLKKVSNSDYEKLSSNPTLHTLSIKYHFNNDETIKYEYHSDVNNKESEIFYNDESLEKNTFDHFGRLKSTDNNISKTRYEYKTKNGRTGKLVSRVTKQTDTSVTITDYSYDSLGNIVKIKDKTNLINYKYDGLSRLVREDNKVLGISSLYEYDTNGNIIKKQVYRYSLNDPDELTEEYDYLYENVVSDVLKGINGLNIEYDTLGNPVVYKGNRLTWEHIRNLSSFNDVIYKYNCSGIRVSKEYEGFKHKYILDGNKILKEKVTNSNTYSSLGDSIDNNSFVSNEAYEISYIYSSTGIIGFDLNRNNETKRYYYNKNIFNDIIGIYDDSKVIVGEYVYDAWGNHEIITDTDEIASINPYRYRSYYYDKETDLYYLNSRYYDSRTGRFINQDDIRYLDSSKVNGLNLYSYCMNNPIMMIDPNGCDPEWWHWLISGAMIIVGLALTMTGVATVIGGALLSAGVSSLVNGYINEATGGSFTAGWVGGIVSGGLSGFGAGFGGQLYYGASEATGLVIFGYLAGSVAFSFAGGFLGTFLGTLVTDGIDGRPFDAIKAAQDATVFGALNVFAGIVNGMGEVASQSGSKGLATVISVMAEAIFQGISYGISKFLEWDGTFPIGFPKRGIPLFI